jgi:Raf kinase inhibitor-like YbhB/YbcL family protein
MRLPGIPLLALLILALAPLSRATAQPFQVTSPDFSPGAMIPAKFTADGANIPPALEVAGVPTGAKSLALIVDDPDAPSGAFTHWIAWNIPTVSKTLQPQTQGANDFGQLGYSGPKPPFGTHRYFFKLSALDTTLQLAPGASRKELDAAMQGHVIATATLMGRYSARASQ